MIVRLSESEDLGHLRSLGKTTGHVRQDGRRGKEEYSNQSNGILSVLSWIPHSVRTPQSDTFNFSLSTGSIATKLDI